MAHQRYVRQTGRLERRVIEQLLALLRPTREERGRGLAHGDLDAHDRVAVVLDALHGVRDGAEGLRLVGPAHRLHIVRAAPFARVLERRRARADHGDVQQHKHAGLALVDHKLLEAIEARCAGGAGVHGGGGAAAQAGRVKVHPDVVHELEPVAVEVHEPRGDQQAGGVELLAGARPRQRPAHRLHRGDHAVLHRDVALHLVEIVRGVDHRAAADDRVEGGGGRRGRALRELLREHVEAPHDSGAVGQRARSGSLGAGAGDGPPDRMAAACRAPTTAIDDGSEPAQTT